MNTECSREVSLAHNLLEIMLPRELRTRIIKRMTSQKVEYVQDGTRVQYGSCLHLFVVAWRDSPISKYLNNQWWLSQHVSSPFRVTTLPITSQEPEDTSSCGFLADNSLQHFAFPSSVLLILRPGIQAARMKAFLLLAQQVLD